MLSPCKKVRELSSLIFLLFATIPFLQKHSKFDVMNGCNYSNRKGAIHRMDGCNWNCELTQYLWKKGWLQVLVSKENTTLENNKSLQVASWNSDGTSQMCSCKCLFEIAIRLE